VPQGDTRLLKQAFSADRAAWHGGQQLKAEMALRFKAIKLGATATQVNLWTLNEVFIFISNHA
jgi:hypothetical protein